MELSVDALKILASKLDASTLEALRGSSKSIRTDLDFALSDNLTYKLPDLRTSWKKVYESFSEESIMISGLVLERRVPGKLCLYISDVCSMHCSHPIQ